LVEILQKTEKPPCEFFRVKVAAFIKNNLHPKCGDCLVSFGCAVLSVTRCYMPKDLTVSLNRQSKVAALIPKMFWHWCDNAKDGLDSQKSSDIGGAAQKV